MQLQDFLIEWQNADGAATEDVLASLLPLVRDVIHAHQAGFVAPLEGLNDLRVEGTRIWFEQANLRPVRSNPADVSRIEAQSRASVEILAEARRTSNLGDGAEGLVRAEIGERGVAFTRPVYLPGYVSWEHELQHHDPVTDIFSLGLLLASLACQLNLSEPADLESFVTHRRNLFALNANLHPAIAQTILRMTELDRHTRAQELPAILQGLERYRDQTISFEVDIAHVAGFRTRDARTRQDLVLTRLRDRLFDISRRNNLLHFRPTMQSVNLTQASIPLLLDIRNIREDQILAWGPQLRQHVLDGTPVSLNKHLNFAEALYLPSLLDRIVADARHDQTEFGFAQLRLVISFLSWANVKEKPVEQFFSPLLLLPVKLVKSKGIRDTYALEVLSSEAEVNPVVRHQFRQLYGIELPESVDLATSSVESLYEFLAGKISASEPAVTLNLVDRPRVDLIHEKARRRLDQYRRSVRVSGRGVRHLGNLDYSYDPANYHPLGIKLFSTRVRTPGSHLRALIENKPRPRSYVAPPPPHEDSVVEKEKSFYQVRDSIEENRYLWNFDLCNVTLANFRYRRMSLVQDYETILQEKPANAAFDAAFSLSPRSLADPAAGRPCLAERFDVVPCDPTQAMAIADARQGKHYIIQGPPGTGKSQTITNLIVDFIALGKRVLFVCEKRAAIDVVFARLRRCGLGPLCALIHDSQTDKKEFVQDLKQTYEQFLDDLPHGPAAGDSRESAQARLTRDLAPLERFATLMEAEVPGTGLSIRRFLDRCIATADLRPRLSPDEIERLPHYQDWWPHAERLAMLERAILDLEPSGVLARHPLRRLATAVATYDRPIEQVAVAADAALDSLDRLVGLMRAGGIPSDQWSSLDRVEQLLDYIKQAEPVVRGGNMPLVEPTGEPGRQFAAAMQCIDQAEAALATARQATGAWRETLPVADVPLAIEQVRQMEGRLFAFLSPAWWRMRNLLKRRYDFHAHAVQPRWSQILGGLARENEAQSAVNQATLDVQKAFHLDLAPRQFAERLVALRNAAPRLPQWLYRIHQALVKSPQAETFVVRTLQAEEPARQLASALAQVVVGVQGVPLHALRDELTAIRREARLVPQVLGVLRELEREPASIGTTVRTMDLTLPQIEAAAASRTWEEMLRQERDLARCDGQTRARCAARLEASYDEWLAANAVEIFHRVRNRFRDNVKTASLAASQLSPQQREFKRRYSQGRRTLEHEFGKSMRFRAIRELVDGDSALVIQDLKPVWLMSPLSVSDTLPLGSNRFDVVLFDEASQVPLEESVPTLYRGDQVIVVGDEMQLPPTDFFAAKSVTDEEGLVVEENGERVSYELDSDSLLNHAARNLPASMLGWHYRSRSESLISFSNWAFYDGRLLTVPERRLSVLESPEGPAGHADYDAALQRLIGRPVSFHLLKDGVYENTRNRREAQFIAQLVRGLLQRRSGLSIGVIAFSEAQQSEIESALGRLAQDDDEFRALYEAELERETDGQFVGLLVKNLENIQGDERDVIILSICYGPGPTGKILMNFGPINKSGGEKRLNVAFSRAKQYMAVVSSITNTAITNDYNDGASCLKNYLRYVESLSRGDPAAAQRVLAAMSRWHEPASSVGRAATEDHCCTQLAAALRAGGYEVDCAVGQSHFRVDLAVRRPHAAEYELGILVDTVAQYEQVETLEREMMRPRLLRDFGWRIALVLAKDWYSDRQRELERLVAILEGRIPQVVSDSDSPDDSSHEAPAAVEGDPTAIASNLASLLVAA